MTILEYCNSSDLLQREQYYFDKLKPQYNILKIAGSSLGSKLSEETKAKISKALKGVYVGENSALLGRLHTEKTKELLSKKAGKNNPLYGKIHSEETSIAQHRMYSSPPYGIKKPVGGGGGGAKKLKISWDKKL